MNMQFTTNSNSITAAITRVNGCFVGATSVLRSVLHLTYMRERLGYWHQLRQQIYQLDKRLGVKPSLDWRPGGDVRLFLQAIAAPASLLAPAAAKAVKLDKFRQQMG